MRNLGRKYIIVKVGIIIVIIVTTNRKCSAQW